MTVNPALDLVGAQASLDYVGAPSSVLLAELQTERKLTVVYINGGRTDPVALAAQRERTDTAAAQLRTLAGNTRLGRGQSSTNHHLENLYAALDSITRGRDDIDRGVLTRDGAVRLYADAINLIFDIFQSIALVAEPDLRRQSQSLVLFTQAHESLAEEDMLIAGANVAGRITKSEYVELIQAIGLRRSRTAAAQAEAAEADLALFRKVSAERPFSQLQTYEDLLMSSGRAGEQPVVGMADWSSAYEPVTTALWQFESEAAINLINRSKPAAKLVIAKLLISTVLGLVAVAMALIASLGFGRDVIRRLADLRDSARELATERLPSVVHRLRHGENLDIAHEDLALSRTNDEIEEVSQAFHQVRQTAVRAAIDESRLRRGLGEVFLNIARRSQALVHRQLSVLDRMERRTSDAEELADLFQVDYLATRMRRHAEDLIIFAGAAPGPGWRHPVPVVDVFRSAIFEIEDHTRIDLGPVPDAAFAGRAVGDLIHLLAELIENAASFSPPQSRIDVGGEIVAQGLVVEIEDRGFGMTPGDLAAVNQCLAQPPDHFDPVGSAGQLGLLVIALLAARHNIKVELRASPGGGITATVLIPPDLVVGSPPITVARALGRPSQRDRAETSTAEVAGTDPATASHTSAGSSPRHARAESGLPRPPRPHQGEQSASGPSPEPHKRRTGLPRRIPRSSLAAPPRTDGPPTDSATPGAAPGAAAAPTDEGRENGDSHDR